MKKNITIALLCFSLAVKADFWTQKANFPGTGVDFPFSFVIGNKAYVGCGRNNALNVTNSFWEYDPAANAWTQKADFGGVVRFAAFGFTIGNKGYAGTGADVNFNPLQDFWEYDTIANSWTQKADVGGGGRYTAVGFAIGASGYFTTGEGNTGPTTDLWKYDPIADQWTQKTSLPGWARDDANGFVIGNSCYVVGGCPGLWLADFWEYNSVTDTWTQKATFPSTARCDAAAFAICEKGYFGTGELGGPYGTDLWQYNPLTNSWIQKTNFPGIGRDEPVGFAIDDRGFIGLGSQDGATFFYDFWEYTPDSTCSLVNIGFTASNHICPGTCTGFTNLSQNATNYLWTFNGANPVSSTDVNPSNICYSTPGNYPVSLIAWNSIDSDTLVLNNYITVYPFPAPQGILQSGDTLFANQGALSYQWYFNGNSINGATGYFYVATQSGDYNVVCSDGNGCEVEAAIFNVVISVESVSGSIHFQIFPNPVTDVLTICNEQSTVGNIEIYNMQGRKIASAKPNSKKWNLSCKTFPAGIYFLQVKTEKGLFVQKFVKQ